MVEREVKKKNIDKRNLRFLLMNIFKRLVSLYKVVGGWMLICRLKLKKKYNLSKDF
jgi:hypothetical protein